MLDRRAAFVRCTFVFVCGFAGLRNYGVEVVFYASCEQQASEALVEFA